MKNKILSLILTVTMLCSAFSFVNVTVEASGTAWDGTAATNFDGGMGTQYDPYQISTAEQFKLFANIVNGVDLEGTVFIRDVSVCAVLTADIVLNAGSNSDTSDWREWTPIGSLTPYEPLEINPETGEPVTQDVVVNEFEGTFDGQDHTVSGLYLDNENQRDVGLFGCIKNSDLRNVGVVNSYVNGGTVTAGVCANSESSMITRCFNTGIVNGVQYVGGVCGAGKYTTITDCYNTGSVSGGYCVGGVCGCSFTDFVMINCYNIGNIIGESYYEGVCGGFADGTITNSYYIDTCGASGDGTAKNIDQFNSGEVAYLLNGSTSEGNLTWFMKDGLPTLDKLADIAVFENGEYSIVRNNSDIDNKVVSITYTVNPTYTVIIPETVALGQTASISAENVIVDEGKQVNVKLTGTSGALNAFTVETQKGAKLSYGITKGGNAVAVGDTVLSINPADYATNSTILNFSAPTGARYAGIYTGTVTFTVSVDEA